jgi:hypothetical protein
LLGGRRRVAHGLRNLRPKSSAHEIPAHVALQHAEFTHNSTGDPEVAALVALLASTRTANATGSNYVIDGGLVKTM